jgi:hypothetical protein
MACVCVVTKPIMFEDVNEFIHLTLQVKAVNSLLLWNLEACYTLFTKAHYWTHLIQVNSIHICTSDRPHIISKIYVVEIEMLFFVV